MINRPRKKQPSTGLLSAAVAVALLSATTVNASINCQSPSGSYSVGDTVSISLGDNGWWPKASDVYSVNANVYCSSGGDRIASFGTSNGGSWTVPSNAYGSCSGNQIYVEYTGNYYDALHLLHILSYTAKCSSMTISAAPAPPPPPPPPPPQTGDPQPPPKPEDPSPPPSNPDPSNPDPSKPSNPAVPGQTAAPGQPVPGHPGYTVIPTVISGTSTFISITATPTGHASAFAAPQSTSSFNPNDPQLPGLPPTPEGNNVTFSSNNNKSDSKVPTAALAAVCGVAAVALIVFGLVMTRKRKQRKQEESDREGGYGKSMDYDYDSTMASTGRGLPHLHTAKAPGYYGNDDLPDFIPYIAPVPSTTSEESEHAEADMAVAATTAAAAAAAAGVGAAAYGFERLSGDGIQRRISNRSDGSLSHAVASAGNAAAGTTVTSENGGAIPFPMPLSTSEALKQQFELMNRFSITSQDFKPEETTPAGAATAAALGSGAAAAAAVNQQMSLKKQLEEEEVKGTASTRDNESLYYLDTDSPQPQQYESARSHTASPSPPPMKMSGRSPVASPATHATGLMGASGYVDGGRSSVYETAPSPSSVYATADSPTLTAVSVNSLVGIHIPALPPSDWRLTGSGRPESSHIRDLIRNVLDDD